MSSYDRLRVLWPDHLGLARGKYLPWRIADRGTSFCIGTYLLDYQRTILDVSIGVDPTGLPDIDAVYAMHDVRPSWEEGTGIIVADLEFHHEPYTVSARHALRTAIADWQELGYQPKIGIELEAYLFEPDGDGGWKPYDTPAAFVYGTGVMADPSGVIAEIMRRAEQAEIPVESINSEFDFPQWELTLEYGEALEAVDNIWLFQQLARETAFEFGLKLTFLGKPIPEKSGNGLHVNMSLSAQRRPQRARRHHHRRRPVRARQAVHRRADRPSRGPRRAVRAHGQRVQAAAARDAVGRLRELGLRPPLRHGARARTPWTRHPGRAPHVRRRRQPVHRRRGGAAGRTSRCGRWPHAAAGRDR